VSGFDNLSFQKRNKARDTTTSYPKPPRTMALGQVCSDTVVLENKVNIYR